MGKSANSREEYQDKIWATPGEIQKQFSNYLYNRTCSEITEKWTCPNCPFDKQCNKNIEAGGEELCVAILGQDVANRIKRDTLKKWEAHKAKPNGIYYIQNSVNEYHSTIQGYFPSAAAAQDGLKKCADWCRPNGTGKIYFQEFGTDKSPRLVYEVK